LEEEEEDDIRKVLEMAGEDEDALLAHIDDEEDSESNVVALEIDNTQKDGEGGPEKATITDKEFYKAMQKVKDRGTNAVPPKKSASAYILFGKEVSITLHDLKHSLTLYEKIFVMIKYSDFPYYFDRNKCMVKSGE
jgi:hypothetical protein